MKRCSTCGVVKAVGEFYIRRRAGKIGRQARCKVCAAAAQMNWRAQNLAHCKAASLQWNAEHPEKVKVANAKWARTNATKIEAQQQRYRETHREVAAARTSRWRDTHPGKNASTVRQWQIKNSDKVNASAVRRKAIKLQATPGWTNHVAIGAFYAFAAIQSKMVGKPYHVDHIVPLKSKLVCGLHTHYNLQVLPGKENMSKGNRHWPDMPEVRI